MKPNDGTLRERDEQLRQDVVTRDLSRYTETMFSKMDAMDKSTFNILVQIARDAARVETLHQVNAIFCQGLSSSLSLEFMRDMMERCVRAEQREADKDAVCRCGPSGGKLPKGAQRDHAANCPAAAIRSGEGASGQYWKDV